MYSEIFDMSVNKFHNIIPHNHPIRVKCLLLSNHTNSV